VYEEIWTFREMEPGSTVDLSGFDVEAVDGAIGHVDEATFDVGASYIVVDTGSWIFGKKVVLPAGTIDRIDLDDRKIWVGRTKEQIKGAPEFDPETYRDERYRESVGGYYGGGPNAAI
jgi:hypothetical protein